MSDFVSNIAASTPASHDGDGTLDVALAPSRLDCLPQGVPHRLSAVGYIGTDTGTTTTADTSHLS